MPSRLRGGMNRFARVGDDADAPSDTPIAVGTTIEAEYLGEGIYYAGVVTAGPEADGSYTVRYYDDGVVETRVPDSRMRVDQRPPIAVGTAVEAGSPRAPTGAWSCSSLAGSAFIARRAALASFSFGSRTLP